MAKNNPSNPFSRDEVATQREMPTPVQKAKVVGVEDHPDENGYHTVRIRVYGEPDSQYFRAPVVVPHKGDVTIPERGDDVLVMFGPNDKPWIIGFWYALDRAQDDLDTIEVPEYDEGDRIIGNGSGSFVKIAEDGHIEIVTEGNQRVDIDYQSAASALTTDFDVPGDDTYYQIPYDSAEDNVEGIFDASTGKMTTLADGLYRTTASLEFPTPGQNNSYTLAIFVNGNEEKRTSRQSSVNEPMSVQVQTSKRLNPEDTVEIRVKQDSGTTRTVLGDRVTTEFNIRRVGI